MEHLIIKYINGEISKEELILLKEGLEDPKTIEQLKDYLELESSIQLSLNDIDPENIYRSLNLPLTPQTKVRRLSPKFRLIRYAAAIILLIGLATTLKFFLSPEITEFTPDATIITLKLDDGTIKEFDEEEAVISVDDFTSDPMVQATENATAIHYNEINVPYGKKATVKLSDNSQVILNSGSLFKYPSSFEKSGTRNVTLEGEAYFTVTKDAEKPFIVETGQMNVEVLGTEFNLSCFNDDNQTMAVLIEGSIRAQNTLNNASLTIKPGEAATLKDEYLTVGQVDIQKHTAWLHGDLLFIDDTFETVLKKLERHFNVAIINNNPSLNRVRYNGRFNTETITQILDAFKVNTDFEYSIENNQVIIKNQMPMK